MGLAGMEYSFFDFRLALERDGVDLFLLKYDGKVWSWTYKYTSFD